MLLLSFAIHLDAIQLDHFVPPHGPLFHRWLPDGRNDAVALPTADNRNSITLWFERRGFVEGGFIRYDRNRSEVDQAIMRRQGNLEAGHVLGEAEYAALTESELTAIRSDGGGTSEYIGFGKRVVQFLQPPLSAFVDLLRTQYGQYWLPELRPWDSRRESLGAYCSTTLWLRWRERPDQEWRRFLPTDQSSTIVVEALPRRGCGEYLTEADWRHIQATFQGCGNAPLALRVLARAHELQDTGHVREALIQAVTGIELSIESFLTARNTRRSSKIVLPPQFFNLPLKAQLAVVVTASDLVPEATLERATKAIDLRNDIVHEGKACNDPSWELLLALMECGQALLGLTELKSPVLYAGNELSGPA
jgi:hypothetical protein